MDRIRILTKDRVGLRKKTLEVVHKKIERLIANDGWKPVDIARECGIPQSRVAEIRTYWDYSHNPVSEQIFRLLLRGGIVTVDEIRSGSKLTPGENALLEQYRIYEDPDLTSLLDKAGKLGIDVGELLKRAIKAAQR